jgi:DNA-binding transcriptional LysR family regulator
MNLRAIDLNLLVIFDALMAERSITAAAKRVGMSTSAMSHALRRLRDTFNDPLFERTLEGLRPTQRALDLDRPVRTALLELQHGLSQQLDFDPATSGRTFNIRISDFLVGCLLPRLCARVRADAPGVTLFVEYLSRDAIHRPGDIHLSIAAGERGPEYRQERIWSDVFVVAMRRDHPAARLPLTLERYSSLPHLRVMSANVDGRPLDDLLDNKGLVRRAALTIPSLAGVIPILQHTDLCTVLPQQWINLYKGLGELATRPLPVEGVEYTVDMIWHQRDDRESGHRWLRRLMTEEFAMLYATARGSVGVTPHRLDSSPIAARC